MCRLNLGTELVHPQCRCSAETRSGRRGVYFRYLHFTTEPEAEMNGDSMRKGATKRVLRFSFAIPPVDRVRGLTRRCDRASLRMGLLA